MTDAADAVDAADAAGTSAGVVGIRSQIAGGLAGRVDGDGAASRVPSVDDVDAVTVAGGWGAGAVAAGAVNAIVAVGGWGAGAAAGAAAAAAAASPSISACVGPSMVFGLGTATQ